MVDTPFSYSFTGVIYSQLVYTGRVELVSLGDQPFYY